MKADLDDLLVSAVDETLKQVFREAGAKVVYNYLKNNSDLKLEEIAEKPQVFLASLRRLLGSGALVIEKMMRAREYMHALLLVNLAIFRLPSLPTKA